MSCVVNMDGTLGQSSRGLSAARTVCHHSLAGARASITFDIVVCVILSWDQDKENHSISPGPWKRGQLSSRCFKLLPIPLG